MREILFRGKLLESVGWVDGNLFLSDTDGRAYILAGSRIVTIEWEVDPSTVGQYTGLKDKHGNRIFEGDIVRYTFDSPDDPTATENGLKVRTGRIFWSDWRASFAVTAGRNLRAGINNDVAIYVRGRQVYEYVRGANTVEVIGNIHDNPELLKED